MPGFNGANVIDGKFDFFFDFIFKAILYKQFLIRNYRKRLNDSCKGKELLLKEL